MESNDFENAMLDAVSFFLDVVFTVKSLSISVISTVRSTQASHVSTAIQPNCDLFFAKNQVINHLGPLRESSDS